MALPEALHFFVQLILLLTSALLAGRLAARFKMPRVVGEISAGILLGPSFLGAAAPNLQAWLFPSDGAATTLRATLGKFALLIFLFVAGLETNLPATRAERRRVISISFFGLAVPFLISWALAMALPTLFGANGLQPWFPFFLGTALSISALPVIARIFMDLQLERSGLAATVLSAAMIDDLAGWGLFVILLHKLKAGGALSIGTLGAFFAGTLCGKLRSSAAAKMLRHGAVTLFAPFYFAGIGLQIHLWRDFSPLLSAVLLSVACAGKMIGGAVGARLAGLPWRNAFAIGCAMNARGAMVIILSTVAHEQGIISPSLHTGLVFVALATSLMAGPFLNAFRDRGMADDPLAQETP
jgi:Kef-type K+ transport system membrane component KefB